MQASWITRHDKTQALDGLRTIAQVLSVFLFALVAGSTFGIWLGYDPAAYSALTFLETHQGAVRGLNTLLPSMGLGALALTGLLAWLNRHDRPVLAAYVAALLLIAAAGAITRLVNQPINAEIMIWTADTMPDHWGAVRDTWWNWHVVRTFASMAGMLALLIAVHCERSS